MNSINELKQVITPLAQQYGAERIFLFGSYARGEATEHSDIDLRIDKGAIRGLQFASLIAELEDVLGKKVDLISTKGMDSRFLETIKPEEILLYERK
ncbi:nucleotidyltransferase domain-containing protein [bacterium]|nr:nucleotidyltransferase domain-containing protein [bacterium]